MTKQHSCETTREMVFNYRRGELSEVDAALFEDALDSCPECARYADRVIEMLDTAAEAEAAEYLGRPVDDAFADDLFDAIFDDIEGGEREDADAPLAQRAPRSAVDVEMEFGFAERSDATRASEATTPADAWEDPSSSAWSHNAVVFLAAAAVTIAVGAAVLIGFERTRAPEPTTPAQLRHTSKAGEAAVAALDAATPEEHEADADPLLDTMVAQSATTDAVKVFANPGAVWTLEDGREQKTLHLSRGTVLVEFLPRVADERLRVVTQHTEVDVLGTVFYVSTERAQDTDARTASPRARVGVLTGKVRVIQEAVSGQPRQQVTLRDGEEFDEAGPGRVRPMDASTRRKGEGLVDLEQHRATLRRLRLAEAGDDTMSEDVETTVPTRVKAPPEDSEKGTAPEDRAAAPAKKAAPQPELGELRRAADRALRAKHYERAAAEYERLLARLPTGSAERARVRLELSRLYMRNLGDSERARHHLRVFVEQHPEDVMAPSARRKLCRLLGPDATKDPACVSMQLEP